MNVKKLILETLQKKGKITVRDIVKKTGFSRAYINRFFCELRDEGRIILIGGARRSKYVLAEKKSITAAKKTLLNARRILTNKNLSEDIALDAIKKQTGIFLDMPKNVAEMLTYAFLEMLNNAIEHSQSQKIEIRMKRDADIARFDVIDKGIGIFRNIMRKRWLENELEAIQDLLKGKQTEGIFFTSKIADMLIIQGSKKKLIFNNIINDIFIENIKNRTGTKVTFAISIDSKKQLADAFKKFTDASYKFSKTVVAVKLYKMGESYISRSQARRIMAGLDKFKTIVLDFKNIKTIGQAFADEIFRVWQNYHKNVRILPKNTNENINFMINRALLSKKK